MHINRSIDKQHTNNPPNTKRFLLSIEQHTSSVLAKEGGKETGTSPHSCDVVLWSAKCGVVVYCMCVLVNWWVMLLLYCLVDLYGIA